MGNDGQGGEIRLEGKKKQKKPHLEGFAVFAALSHSPHE